jgi:hypothetical protein
MNVCWTHSEARVTKKNTGRVTAVMIVVEVVEAEAVAEVQIIITTEDETVVQGVVEVVVGDAETTVAPVEGEEMVEVDDQVDGVLEDEDAAEVVEETIAM